MIQSNVMRLINYFLSQSQIIADAAPRTPRALYSGRLQHNSGALVRSTFDIIICGTDCDDNLRSRPGRRRSRPSDGAAAAVARQPARRADVFLVELVLISSL